MRFGSGVLQRLFNAVFGASEDGQRLVAGFEQPFEVFQVAFNLLALSCVSVGVCVMNRAVGAGALERRNDVQVVDQLKRRTQLAVHLSLDRLEFIEQLAHADPVAPVLDHLPQDRQGLARQAS